MKLEAYINTNYVKFVWYIKGEKVKKKKNREKTISSTGSNWNSNEHFSVKSCHSNFAINLPQKLQEVKTFLSPENYWL